MLPPGTTLPADLAAAAAVTVLSIPQGLAYAVMAGLPPAVGLYTAIAAPLAAAFFVSSPWLQTGPVATTSVLAFGTLSALAAPGSQQQRLGGNGARVRGMKRRHGGRAYPLAKIGVSLNSSPGAASHGKSPSLRLHLGRRHSRNRR